MLAKPSGALLVVSLLTAAACNLLTGADDIVLTVGDDDDDDGAGLTGLTGSGGTGTGAWGGAGGTGGSTEPVVLVAADGVSITQIVAYQGVKRPLMEAGGPASSDTPLVERRDALVRVFYTLSGGYNGQPVTARLEIGAQSWDNITLLGSGSNESSLLTTINFDVPGAVLVSGAGYHVTIMQPSTQSTGSNAAASYPSSGTQEPLPLESSGPQLRVVLVPISYAADGSNRLPDTSASQLQILRDTFFGIYPTPTIDLQVHAAVGWDYPVDAAGGGWDDLLNAMAQFRQDDGAAADEYYYGAFSPADSIYTFCSSGCVAGLGFVAGPSDVDYRVAIGLGFPGDITAGAAAHETGHLHGLLHAPCGNPDGVDPSYPYANASIGVWGYDLVSKSLRAPNDYVDLMSYCDPTWVSDYHFKALFERIRTVNGVSGDVLPPQRSLERTSYERVTLGPDGKLAWREPISLAAPPAGALTTVLVETAGRRARLEAHWIPYGDGVGGMILFAQQATVPTSVSVRVGHGWHTLRRDRMVHRGLTCSPRIP